MTKKLNVEKGKKGEDIAAGYMQKKGFKLVERNARDKYGELDLVLAKGPSLVFVEVKARQKEITGTPEDAITFDKRRRLKNAAQKYVYFRNYKGMYRIDAVCIVFSTGRISHYESIV